MEPDHTPNEFPFSSAPGTELLQVPLSYRTSSDGRQLVYTITTCGGGGGSSSGGGGNGSGSGGGSLTPAMLADTAGLLDVLKQDTLVAVDALDGFAAHADQVAAVAPRPTAVYQDDHQMSANAELVDAVAQYVQQMANAQPPASLVEIKHRSGEVLCFLCDSPAARGMIEIFGETNILSASKTPVCVKLECLLDCPLPAERLHSDAICLACLKLLEEADDVDFRLKELQERSEQLTRQVRQRFTRTVLGRKVEYAGWRPVPLPHTPEEEEAKSTAAPSEPPPADCDVTEEWPEERGGSRASSPSPSVITGDLADPDDPTDDLYVALATSKAESAARKKKTGSKARVKVVVPDPRDPARSKVKYVYDHSHACHICGKTFAWQGHLTKHLQTHTGERPLNCHICGQTFRWSSHLTSHLRRHNDDKPFVCNVCGKRFVSSSVFKGHMRTHTDEKPFMCGVCGKQFRDKSNLRTHEWVHTDKRPHRCGPCDRGFLTTSALKVHNRTVHGLAPAARAK